MDRSILNETLIVVPIYDEWPHVARVLDNMKSKFPSILIIEDGVSHNALKNYSKKNNIEYISVLFNLGAWSAIQIGFRYALLKGYKYVITFDGDGQHLPDEVEKLLIQLKLGYDLVIGSCLERGGFFRRTCWLILRKLSNINIYDITSGFRAYSRLAFQKFAQFDQSDLEYQDLGVLLLARKWGLRYCEVPIKMGQRLGGHSKVFHGVGLISQYLLTTLISVTVKWK